MSNLNHQHDAGLSSECFIGRIFEHLLGSDYNLSSTTQTRHLVDQPNKSVIPISIWITSILELPTSVFWILMSNIQLQRIHRSIWDIIISRASTNTLFPISRLFETSPICLLTLKITQIGASFQCQNSFTAGTRISDQVMIFECSWKT